MSGCSSLKASSQVSGLPPHPRRILLPLQSLIHSLCRQSWRGECLKTWPRGKSVVLQHGSASHASRQVRSDRTPDSMIFYEDLERAMIGILGHGSVISPEPNDRALGFPEL